MTRIRETDFLSVKTPKNKLSFFQQSILKNIENAKIGGKTGQNVGLLRFKMSVKFLLVKKKESESEIL